MRVGVAKGAGTATIPEAVGDGSGGADDLARDTTGADARAGCTVAACTFARVKAARTGVVTCRRGATCDGFATCCSTRGTVARSLWRCATRCALEPTPLLPFESSFVSSLVRRVGTDSRSRNAARTVSRRCWAVRCAAVVGDPADPEVVVASVGDVSVGADAVGTLGPSPSVVESAEATPWPVVTATPSPMATVMPPIRDAFFCLAMSTSTGMCYVGKVRLFRLLD
jgi:hypothetical protein